MSESRVLAASDLESQDTGVTAPAAEDLVDVDLLIEDVSIDGMCGVY